MGAGIPSRSVSVLTRTGYSPNPVRWVQKIVEGGEEGRHTAYVVMDADARRLGVPLRGVSEDDAAEMVATGEWKYVYELARAS